jgi:hypothetical protein
MKPKLKKAIIKFIYFSAKITSLKAFWFLTGISCHLLAFRFSEMKSLDLNMLFETVIVYIIGFELMYYFYFKKQLNGLKKSKEEFKEILDNWDEERKNI